MTADPILVVTAAAIRPVGYLSGIKVRREDGSVEFVEAVAGRATMRPSDALLEVIWHSRPETPLLTVSVNSP